MGRAGMRRRGAARLRCFVALLATTALAIAGAASPVAARPGRPTVRLEDVVRADVMQRLTHGAQRVIIQLRDDPAALDVRTHASSYGVSVGRIYRNVPAFAATIDYAQAARLAASGEVRSIELDARIALEDPHPAWANFGPPDPRPIRAADPGIAAAATAFHLDGDAAHDGARTYSKGDSVIAFIDSGIDVTHPDLDGGKVLTFHNFVTSPAPSCPAPPPNPSTPFDDNSHGTHVASIAAGEGDADAAHTGVAPAAALVVLKAFDCAGSGSTSDIAAALDWMITNRTTYGIDVASMSFTSVNTDGTDIMSVLVNQATAAGIVTVAAAGNAGPNLHSVGAPGTARYVLTVGAAHVSSKGRAVADFSSRGPTLDGRIKPDVLAPGVEIDAAWANNPADRYRYLSGTSMATPVLSGLAALALQAKPTLRPSGTVCNACADGVVDSSMSTPFNDLARARARAWNAPGLDNDSGAGMTEAYPLLAAAAGQPLTGGPAYPVHAVRSGHLDSFQTAVWPLRVTDTSKPALIGLSLPLVDGYIGPYWNATIVDSQGNEMDAKEPCSYNEFSGISVGTCFFFGMSRGTHLSFLAPSVGNYFFVLTADTGPSDYVLDFDGFAGVGSSGTPIQLGVSSRATEGGAAEAVGVALGQAPSASTSVRVYGDAQLVVPTTALTFGTGNWNVPQTMNVPAVDDTTVEGLHAGRVFAVTAPGTPFASVAASVPTSLPIVDNDTPTDAPHTERVSVKTNGYGSTGAIDGYGDASAVTPDGAVVAWDSRAQDLQSGDGDGPAPDVFVHDRRTGVTDHVSTGPNGDVSVPAELNGLSDDGTRVLFNTFGELTPNDTNNDFDLYLRDRVTNTTTRVDLTSSGGEMAQRPCRANANFCTFIPASLSGNGRFIAFITDSPMVPGDTNGTADVYRRDLVTGAVTRVSVNTSGAPGSGSSDAGLDRVAISRDGNRVLFTSGLDGLASGDRPGALDLFVHDMTTGTTRLLNTDVSGTAVDLSIYDPVVFSPSGRYAMYAAPGASYRLFVKDLDTGATRIANKRNDGSIGPGYVQAAGISDDGANALFFTDDPALALIQGWVLRNLDTGATQIMPKSINGANVLAAGQASLSATARFGAFTSPDDRVVTGDTNGNTDAFLRVVSGAGSVGVVTAPRAGDTWTAGSSYTIRWRAVAPTNATASIQLVTPGGTTTVATNVPASQESFTYTVPANMPPTTAAVVRVTIDGYVASSAPFTISAAPVVASLGGASFYEGDSASHVVDFAVTLSRPATTTVTLGYSVLKGAPDTATPGVDFVATSGTLTLQPTLGGKTPTVAYIPVTIKGDTTKEPDETFTVQLTSATGATLGRSVSRSTIYNDDPQSGLVVSVGNAGIVEGNAVATVGGANTLKMHVSLSRPVPSGKTVTVKYMVVSGSATGGTAAGPGIDLIKTTSPVTLTFTAGQNDKTVNVKVFADTMKEPDETFTLTLTSVTGAAVRSATGAGTIRNDD